MKNVKGVTWEEKENLALFQGWLVRLLENLLTLILPLPKISPCWDNTLSDSLPLILGRNSKS